MAQSPVISGPKKPGRSVQYPNLYRPDLDIDLAVESIEHPDRYPLLSQVRPASARKGTRRAR